MKKIFSILFLSCNILLFFGQTARQEIYENVRLSASNYYAYPTPNAKLMPAPKGYQPFYISTYARHGSRFLLRSKSYKEVFDILQAAEENGKLTNVGKDVLAKVDSIYRMSDKRLGELTPLGARQHREIATRMFYNFPEIFGGNTAIDARSSVVIRCILSMTSELLQLKELNPKLRFTFDASEHDRYYLIDSDKSVTRLRNLPKAKAFVDDLWKKYVHPDRLMKVLFNDSQYVIQEVDNVKLMSRLFDLATNMQSHDVDLDLYPIFTKEEIYDLWQGKNLRWYVTHGPSPLTESKMPYMEAALLKNILDVADIAVQKKENTASLRFGHESVLLPLAALLELNDVGKASENTDEIMDFWRNYKIFPMASNIQFIFYRSTQSSDVLVKVLLNEHEARLPVPSNLAPYYRWTEVEKYYRTKLANFEKSRPEMEKLEVVD